MNNFVNVGFGNIVNFGKVISIINSDSAPAKRMIQKAKEEDRIIDATQGRRTKAVVVLESSHLILSALQPETLAGRAMADNSEG